MHTLLEHLNQNIILSLVFFSRSGYWWPIRFSFDHTIIPSYAPPHANLQLYGGYNYSLELVLTMFLLAIPHMYWKKLVHSSMSCTLISHNELARALHLERSFSSMMYGSESRSGKKRLVYKTYHFGESSVNLHKFIK
jgi:hypothetical protein